MSFAAGLFAVPNNPSLCIPYIISVISGSLPPGLQLGNPDCAWTITGTPTKAGTYAFTVQITPNTFNPGPSGTQQLTITIGTGRSDRPAGLGAGWNGHLSNLQVDGWDANNGALWSVSVTSTGRVLISNQPSRVTYPIDGFLIVQTHTGYPCPGNGCDLTVTNSLGTSVTVHLGPPSY
jgi:hypothetical protein